MDLSFPGKRVNVSPWPEPTLNSYIYIKAAFIKSDLITIHTDIHTPMAESTMQGDSHLLGSSLGKLAQGRPGIELATFWLQVTPLYHLRYFRTVY